MNIYISYLKISSLHSHISLSENLFSASKQLEDCVSSLNLEQRLLCGNAAGTTLSAKRLVQRLVVFQRYFIALGQYYPSDHTKSNTEKLSLPSNHNKLFPK